MFSNSPLFIKKILTLLVASLFFSFMSSLFIVATSKEEVAGSTLTAILLIGLVIIGVIYFSLVHFIAKRKNSARIILLVLLILGILSGAYGLVAAEEYHLAEYIFDITALLLDLYIIIILLGDEVKLFITSGRLDNSQSDSYKTWFSTLSSILLIIMIGAKFLNKNELNHKKISQLDSSQSSENLTSEDNNSNDTSMKELNCKDDEVIKEFTDTINNSPGALTNHIKIVDVDTDKIEKISFTYEPYELKCRVIFTLNNAIEVPYIMRIFDKNGNGKMMIEGTPDEQSTEQSLDNSYDAEAQEASDAAAQAAAAAYDMANAQSEPSYIESPEPTQPAPMQPPKTAKENPNKPTTHMQYRLMDDVELNNGVFAIKTTDGFFVLQQNNLSNDVANNLGNMQAGECFNVNSYKPLGKTNGDDIQKIYPVSC